MSWPAIVYLAVHGFALALLAGRYWFHNRKEADLIHLAGGESGSNPRLIESLVEAQQSVVHLRGRLRDMLLMEAFHLALLFAGGFFDH